MHLSFNQILQLLNSTKNTWSLLDVIIPLLSTIVGGILSVFTTLLLLDRQYKNTQKEIEKKEKIKKKEQNISDLKNYYIQFNNYFLYLFNKYNIFFLVLNEEMEYKEWFEVKIEQKPYDFIDIQLKTNIYGLNDEFNNFDNLVKNLNELSMPFTYLKEYKKGMKLEINKSKFSELLEELIEENTRINDIIITSIKKLDIENSGS